jgi:hypothetical protein
MSAGTLQLGRREELPPQFQNNPVISPGPIKSFDIPHLKVVARPMKRFSNARAGPLVERGIRLIN